MKEDPPLHIKCRDKFLVQSIAILPHQDSSNMANLVSTVALFPSALSLGAAMCLTSNLSI